MELHEQCDYTWKISMQVQPKHVKVTGGQADGKCNQDTCKLHVEDDQEHD